MAEEVKPSVALCDREGALMLVVGRTEPARGPVGVGLDQRATDLYSPPCSCAGVRVGARAQARVSLY